MLQRLILILVLFSCAGRADDFDDEILARVGEKTITLSEFSSRYFDYLLNSGVKDNIVTRRAILNNMINEILLYYYDDNTKIFNTAAYQNELEWNKKQAVISFLKDREVYAKINVNDQETREAFMKVNERIAARHLFAETEEEADNLYTRLLSGSTFDELASEVFTDEILKNNGGYLGYFTWGDMDPAFEEAAYQLKVGEISKPVKTKYGYSIIKVEDRVKHPLLTEYEYQQKKRHLKRVLKIRKKIPAEREYLSKIFNKEKAVLYDDEIEKIFSELITSTAENPGSFSTSVCAEYDNKKYLSGDILNRINKLPVYHRAKIQSISALKSAIQGLVIQDLLLKEAEEKEYDSDSEVIETIAKLNNNSFIKYKRAEISEAKNFNESEFLDYYKKNIDYYSHEALLNVEQLLTPYKFFADTLKQMLTAGLQFDEVVQRFPKDCKISESGFLPKSRFGDFKDTLWSLQTGEVTGPFDLNGVFAFYKIKGKKDRHPKDFSEVKENVLRALRVEKQQSIMKEYIDKIYARVNVEVDTEMLGNVKSITGDTALQIN